MIAVYGFNTFVTKPILTGVFDLTLRTTEYQALFNSDIVSFFFTALLASALILSNSTSLFCGEAIVDAAAFDDDSSILSS